MVSPKTRQQCGHNEHRGRAAYKHERVRSVRGSKGGRGRKGAAKVAVGRLISPKKKRKKKEYGGRKVTHKEKLQLWK